MRKVRKTLFISLAFSALSLATAGVLATNNASANAQGNDFWLVDGASVRFGSMGNGIRYTFQITEDSYDDYNAYTKFGILIAPEDTLTAGKELTPANVFGADGATPIYNWAVKDTDGNWSYTNEAGKTQIVNLETNSFVDNTAVVGGETVAVKEFYGSLVNLLDGTYDEVKNPYSVNNVAREFRAVGYVGESTDGVHYTYTFVGDEDNVRSMAYVAQEAITYTGEGALEGSEKEELQKTYLDKVNTVASNYTVEYYLEQADGSFAVDKQSTQVVQSTIGARVVAPEKTFDGYYFDENNAENATTGTTYANDKLVLKRYYKRGVQFFDNTIQASDVVGGMALTISDSYVLEEDGVTKTPVVQVTTSGNNDWGSPVNFTSLVTENTYDYYVWKVYAETAGKIEVWNESWTHGNAHKDLKAGWNEIIVEKSEISIGFTVLVVERNFEGASNTVTVKFGALKGVNAMTVLGTAVNASNFGVWGYGFSNALVETADGKAYDAVLNVTVDNADMGGLIVFDSWIYANDYAYYIANIWSETAGSMTVRNGDWNNQATKTLTAGWNQVRIEKSEVSNAFEFYFNEGSLTGTATANIQLGSIYGVKGVRYVDGYYSTSTVSFSGGVTAKEEIALSADGTEYFTQIKVTTVDGNDAGSNVNFTGLIPAENPGYAYYELTVWCEYEGTLFWLGDTWYSKYVTKGWNTLRLTWEEVQQYQYLYVQSHNFKDENGTGLTKDTQVSIILGDLVGITE